MGLGESTLAFHISLMTTYKHISVTPLTPAVGAERASEALTRSGETDPAAVARASEALAREIDSMELLAAHLWAQLEGAGIDPSGAMRRSSR